MEEQELAELLDTFSREDFAAGGRGLAVAMVGCEVIGLAGPLELIQRLERAAEQIISPWGAEALRHGYAYN